VTVTSWDPAWNHQAIQKIFKKEARNLDGTKEHQSLSFRRTTTTPPLLRFLLSLLAAGPIYASIINIIIINLAVQK
jgi:hypothetical protein